MLNMPSSASSEMRVLTDVTSGSIVAPSNLVPETARLESELSSIHGANVEFLSVAQVTTTTPTQATTTTQAGSTAAATQATTTAQAGSTAAATTSGSASGPVTLRHATGLGTKKTCGLYILIYLDCFWLGSAGFHCKRFELPAPASMLLAGFEGCICLSVRVSWFPRYMVGWAGNSVWAL